MDAVRPDGTVAGNGQVAKLFARSQRFAGAGVSFSFIAAASPDVASDGFGFHDAGVRVRADCKQLVGAIKTRLPK